MTRLANHTSDYTPLDWHTCQGKSDEHNPQSLYPTGSAPQASATASDIEQPLPQTGTTDTPAASPSPTSENPASFKAWLSENISSRNYTELRKLMVEQFFFGMWLSEVVMETPENAIRPCVQLKSIITR